MLWVVAVALVVIWVLGMATANTMGGLVHILLIVAVASVVVHVFKTKRFA
jgi:uncharacterized protein DUF5670